MVECTHTKVELNVALCEVESGCGVDGKRFVHTLYGITVLAQTIGSLQHRDKKGLRLFIFKMIDMSKMAFKITFNWFGGIGI